MRLVVLMVAFVCGFALLGAEQAVAISAADYGIDDPAVTPKEQNDGQRYGGFPNNRLFNNDTPCKRVTALFATPGMGPQRPEMQAFLRYARVSFMMIDVAASATKRTPPAVESIPRETWKMLPILVPSYCRMHPADTLLDGIGGAYRAVRITNGLPDD